MTDATTPEQCPACGSTSVVAGFVRSAAIHCCGAQGCGLRFLPAAVRPNAANDNVWYGEWISATALQVSSARVGMASCYRRQLSLIARSTDSRTILDVGSGLGLFVAEASDAGWSPTGLELSPHGREFASRRLDADVRSGFDEVASGSIGIVRASHVLEHIPAPRTFLDDCRRVLEPRGVMLVIVPHREPLVETVLNRARRARGNRELAGAIYPDMHVLGFDHVSLPALMSRAGFEQVWLRGVGMGDPTFYPWFYDDLVHVLPFRRWAALGWRYCVPRIVNRLAAPFGRGDWIAGLFRRRD